MSGQPKTPPPKILQIKKPPNIPPKPFKKLKPKYERGIKLKRIISKEEREIYRRRLIEQYKKNKKKRILKNIKEKKKQNAENIKKHNIIIQKFKNIVFKAKNQCVKEIVEKSKIENCIILINQLLNTEFSKFEKIVDQIYKCYIDHKYQFGIISYIIDSFTLIDNDKTNDIRIKILQKENKQIIYLLDRLITIAQLNGKTIKIKVCDIKKLADMFKLGLSERKFNFVRKLIANNQELQVVYGELNDTIPKLNILHQCENIKDDLVYNDCIIDTLRKTLYNLIYLSTDLVELYNLREYLRLLLNLGVNVDNMKFPSIGIYPNSTFELTRPNYTTVHIWTYLLNLYEMEIEENPKNEEQALKQLYELIKIFVEDGYVSPNLFDYGYKRGDLRNTTYIELNIPDRGTDYDVEDRYNYIYETKNVHRIEPILHFMMNNYGYVELISKLIEKVENINETDNFNNGYLDTKLGKYNSHIRNLLLTKGATIENQPLQFEEDFEEECNSSEDENANERDREFSNQLQRYREQRDQDDD